MSLRIPPSTDDADGQLPIVAHPAAPSCPRADALQELTRLTEEYGGYDLEFNRPAD